MDKEQGEQLPPVCAYIKKKVMPNSNLAKGIFAGLIAGIAATAAKTIWEDHFPVRSEDTPTPPALLANRISEQTGNGPLTDEETSSAETAVHIAFGVGTGALYGALAEEVPDTTAGFGLAFGTAFWVGTHGSVIPGMGLEPWPTKVDPRSYAVNEFLGHLVYGMTLEAVRRVMR
jgi:putative membrane protein